MSTNVPGERLATLVLAKKKHGSEQVKNVAQYLHGEDKY